MQKLLVIASTNTNKVREFQTLFSKDKDLKILGLCDLVDHPEIVDETSDTYAGNAFLKADYWFQRLQVPILSDDSGLEVESLNGWPGVISARIAATDKDCREALITRLIQNGHFGLSGANGAKARFVCVLCLRASGLTRYFEGILPGTIRNI
ncbi:MAG: non-canonical purine NTP pyrophosphatase, partial [Candidatus Cloacimonetes bacterium]|nr:non-canonical purine NTP pyrophosphatase [Candidatus Cloacimonadota bacterium]